MTTFFCKSRGPRGQVHERMGHHGKVTPQVTLSFPPGGPPILDPAPAPAKPRGHWWNHLTSIFTSQPPVCWVNPQLVRERPLPPMAHYSGPPHQYNMPPPALNPGQGLWHAAPPGNQQQQLMMEPLLMLQGSDTNGYFPMAKMDSSCFYPMSKTETNGFFPMAKETSGYCPTAKIETYGVFPMTKTDTNSFFAGTKVDTDSYIPTGKTEANSFSQTANTHRQTYTTSWPSVEPSTTTSTTTSKPLNPYAQEWVPPGYMTTPVPGTANITITKPQMVGEEMPNHHYEDHHSTPVIPYTPQEFSEMTEKVEEVRMNACPSNPPPSATSILHLPSGSVLECQLITEQDQRDDNVSNVALLSPSGTLSKGMSASSEVRSPSHLNHSQNPLYYQESEGERGPSESAVMSPGVTSTVSPAMVTPSAKKTETGIMFSPQSPTSLGIPGSVVSPDSEQVCVKLPASPDCVKNARPDPEKPIPTTSSSSESPHQDQEGCVEFLSSLDCAKNARPDPALSSQHTNSSSESPEGQSPTQTSNSASETWKSSPKSISASPTSPEGQSPTQTSGNSSEICLLGPECKALCVVHLENATLEQRCQNLGIDDVCDLEVPGSVKEGSDSASMSSNARGVPDSADRSSSASLSYARMVERVTPSPPPPPPSEQDRYRGVEQPIPKIFQRDQTPPRETPTPKIEAQRLPELFRRPSKSQRTRSRKFLQELKESSQNGDGGVWCPSSPSSVSSTSSVSSSSSSCELSQSPNLSHMPSSPSHTIPSSSSSPSSPVPISPLRCVLPMPKSTPQAIPLSPSTPVSPSGPTESPNRVRSESESSTASLDIDFMDDVDRIPAIHPPSTPSSISTSRRPINRFLACILGSGDSESEDEEDWDDWDEVCVDGDVFAAPHDLDDSWETFGLEMVVMQCQTEPAKQSQNKLPAQCQVWPEIQYRCELPAECRLERKESEVQCQNGLPPKCQIDWTIQCQNVLPAECQLEDTRTDQTDTSYLAEINERWEREVEQEVQGKSAPRVMFGSTKVHPMVVWGHAYREARRGPWEQLARDRARFKQRIGTAELALSWILQPSHRTAVYERLHAPNTTTTTTTTTTTPS